MGILFKRKKAEYTANERVWQLCDHAYSGGERYIHDHIIKHTAENDLEYEERQKRAHYFNYPRAIAQRITSFVLAVEPARIGANPDLIEDFSLTGLRINDVMRQVSTMLTVFGRAWVLVDVPSVPKDDTGTLDMAAVQSQRIRPYARALKPLEVIDWAYAPDGKLLWAVVEEKHIYDSDPFKLPVVRVRRRLWTREKWALYERASGAESVIAEGVNPTGEVPLIEVTEPDGFGMDCNHWFEDVVRISNSILNNESEAQMNIVKQMFGLLVVSRSFASGALRFNAKDKDGKEEQNSFAMVLSRSAAAIEENEEKGITRYISPSGVETATIRSENEKLKIELYETVGLAMQSRSREAQSSESKSWDFQNVSQFLANRVDIIESAEVKAWKLFSLWDSSVSVPEVTYNRKFALRDLEKSISGLLQLSSLPVGTEFQKQIARTGRELLNEIAEISDADNKAIDKEIESMEAAPVPEMGLQDLTQIARLQDSESARLDSDSKIAR